MKKAVVLLSGGLDSVTILYIAKQKKYKPFGLIFDYGQRHKREIEHAKKIARSIHCEYKLVHFSMPWLGSSLLDKKKLGLEHLDLAINRFGFNDFKHMKTDSDLNNLKQEAGFKKIQLQFTFQASFKKASSDFCNCVLISSFDEENDSNANWIVCAQGLCTILSNPLLSSSGLLLNIY